MGQPSKMMLTVTRFAFVTALLAMVGLTTSCHEYRQRIDSINLSPGEAVAHNKAVHTVDPWPPEAFRKRHNTSGKRIAVGAGHYDEGPPKKGKNLQNQTQ